MTLLNLAETTTLTTTTPPTSLHSSQTDSSNPFALFLPKEVMAEIIRPRPLQFLDLPLEIRQEIWNFAISLQPRVIKLDFARPRHSDIFWVAEGSIPAETFQVCPEFSDVVLRRYKKSSTVFAKGQQHEEIYVDYRRDTIFLHDLCWWWIQGHSVDTNLPQEIIMPFHNSRIRSLHCEAKPRATWWHFKSNWVGRLCFEIGYLICIGDISSLSKFEGIIVGDRDGEKNWYHALVLRRVSSRRAE